MAARFPGVSAREPRVRCSVGLVDVMATLCVYLGVECREPLFGRSFIDAGGHEKSEAAYIVTEGVMFKPRNRTVRNRSYKLFWEPDGPTVHGAGQHSLYNIREDPGETRDLLSPEHWSSEHERIGSLLASRLQTTVPPFLRRLGALAFDHAADGLASRPSWSRIAT